jgi:transcriptional regulator with XRE-family HTH domain
MLTTTMDAQDAMELTFRLFGLKISDIARKSGVSPESISRYKNKHRDLTASNAFAIIKALPPKAQEFYLELLINEKADLSFSVRDDDELKYTIKRD